ncbi:unnamed protein product [Eruca vesicaria subsp. sativa]|uniref:Regulator of telomere elongation helicase 1 homolog n=1 Tax=Eruca vesicaria subsp. sativa TaxID=29727 RepID=A0ABC8KMQ0_ERUVS|nr:unnamed protein product [Eruca vesicaria subsp. sativa]
MIKMGLHNTNYALSKLLELCVASPHFHGLPYAVVANRSESMAKLKPNFWVRSILLFSITLLSIQFNMTDYKKATKRFPKDLVSLKRAHILSFYMGQPSPFLDLVQQVLPQNQEESNIHSLLAFPLFIMNVDLQAEPFTVEKPPATSDSQAEIRAEETRKASLAYTEPITLQKPATSQSQAASTLRPFLSVTNHRTLQKPATSQSQAELRANETLKATCVQAVVPSLPVLEYCTLQKPATSQSQAELRAKTRKATLAQALVPSLPVLDHCNLKRLTNNPTLFSLSLFLLPHDSSLLLPHLFCSLHSQTLKHITSFNTMVSPKTIKSEEKETQNPKNVYHIGGLQVKFPYQPYGTQLAFMSRVISTLDRSQRDGRCHALLESPTGTGKTLSLLCSVLAWQQSYKSRFPKGNLARRDLSVPDTTQQPSTEPTNEVEVEEPPAVPTIFYASRTHAQITQVIREYRKTAYRVPMAVLGARKRSCTNCHVQGKANLDEKCRSLIKDKRKIKCPQFLRKGAIVAHPSLKNNEVHDIEDLVKIGYSVGGCPYFAAWDMFEVAQIVFCPYSYIVDQLIREKLGEKVRGAIIIFDEAHNMEDIAREAGSIDLGEDTLFKLQSELQHISVELPAIYQPVCDVIDGLISWIGSKKDSLAKRDPEHYFSSWTGDKALRELEKSKITREGFSNLRKCFHDAIETSEKQDDPHLSGISVSTLQELKTTLGYFFTRDGSHTLDYELGLQRFLRKGDSSGSKWTHTLSLWCMNPAVVFKAIVNLSSSIILTSGTLSPMDSFSSELGMQFGTCLEAPHVVDANQQVWAAGIFSGPNNQILNASYKTADAYPFQDALGKSLEEICSIVPGGSLIFFPSYKLMEKLCTRWRETGQWSRLCLEKDIFIEPRGGTTGEFESVLKGYYDCIRGKKRLIGRNRRAGTQDDSKKGGGAAFLSVCRGKVSEGLDFTDDNARAVIIVGIPFPNLHDVLVELKRSYNDTYKSSRNLLGGGEWYCQQAYRALNQAAGRCIRHRFDYGAIIFLDERYRQQRNRVSISKWLRQSIKLYDNFEESMQDLKSFFPIAKEHVDSKMLGYKEVIDLECVVQTEPESSGVINRSSAASSFPGSSGLTIEGGRSPLNKSVNSHALKRKFISSAAIIDLEKETNHDMVTRRIEFGSELRSGNHMYGSKRVQISCLLCRSPLGHPDNGSLYLNCLVTRSSKKYLLSLLKETSSAEMPKSVSVMVTDCSLVDQRLCTKGEGIWCEEDGCVFNTIFCPFCIVPNTCLGVQIMATDSSNGQFRSKILFFADHLNVMDDAVVIKDDVVVL